MYVSLNERLRFVRALRSRPFALLWVGQTISSLGNSAFYTALAWEVLLLTPVVSALVLLLNQTLPGCL